MTTNRFFSYEWDAIAGILAAVIAIILHLLHVIDEQIILPVVLTLMALLFINFIRHTRNNEETADKIDQLHKMVRQMNSALATPDIKLIGPRQLRKENEHFINNMQGEVILFNVCLSMYRTQALYDKLLRPIIENPHVTNIQFVLDVNQKPMWNDVILPLINNNADKSKVDEPRWCCLEKNLSFILADGQQDGPPEALLSFWGEPFMSQTTDRNVPRYILHVQAHSELMTQLIELDRNCQICNSDD